MKNKLFSRLLAATAFLLAFFILPSSASAQGTTCGPYQIQNNLNCPIKVQYQRTCNGSPCSSVVTINIPAMSFITIPPCSCGGTCDVKTTLLMVAGTTISPAPSVSSGNMLTNYTPACGGSSGYLLWDTMITAIN